MTDTNKKAKVSQEPTQQTSIETYKKFIQKHDHNVWSCLTKNENAATLANELWEYRWSVFSNGLSDEFILQSVGFQLAAISKEIGTILIRELGEMLGDTHHNSLFERSSWSCDFKSVFEHVFIPCRMFIAPTFLRSLATSILWILIARIISDGKDTEVLRRIYAHSKDKSCKTRDKIDFYILVLSELSREFFESLTNKLGSFSVLRPFEVIADLPVKLIASHIVENDYRSFALTCKKIYAILSDKKNLGFVVDVRFRREFRENSDKVIGLLDCYYEKGYSITKFKRDAMRAREPRWKYGCFDVDVATVKRHICTILHEESSSIGLILKNGTVEQQKRLFNNENSGVGERNLFGETFEEFLSMTKDWDVVEKICIGDRGEVFQLLKKFYVSLMAASIDPGQFKMLVYCLNNVYMTFTERENMQDLLLSKLHYSGTYIWRIINELFDCDFILDSKKYTEKTQCVMKYDWLAISIWRSETRRGEIMDQFLYAEVASFLVNVECSSDEVLMLWRVKRDYEFWKKVLFELIGCKGKEKTRMNLLLVGFLVDAPDVNVIDKTIPFYRGSPRTLMELAKRIIAEHLQNCHTSLRCHTELIRIMQKLRDRDFWSVLYLERLNSRSTSVSKELFLLMGRSGLVSEKLEYLLRRGVNEKA